MIDQGGSLAGLEVKVSNRKVSYRNGPPLIVSLGGLVAILSFAAGFLGITLGGILLLATAIATLIALATVTMRLGMLPSLIIEQTLRSSSEMLFAPFGASDREEAFRLLQDYLINRIPPILIITDGKIDERSKDSIIIKQGLRGPGNVQIDGASAVLLEFSRKRGVEIQEK